MKKLKKITNILIKAVFGIFITFVVLGSVLHLVAKEKYPTFCGFGGAIVNSGSMKPTIAVNDLVVTKAADSYKQDDIVLYQTDNSLVIHRIIDRNQRSYLTKGDANNKDDGWIEQAQIKGKLVFRLPKIGVIQEFSVSIILVLLLILVLLTPIKIKKGANETNA